MEIWRKLNNEKLLFFMKQIKGDEIKGHQMEGA
jgi:hypothetical protein